MEEICSHAYLGQGDFTEGKQLISKSSKDRLILI